MLLEKKQDFQKSQNKKSPKGDFLFCGYCFTSGVGVVGVPGVSPVKGLTFL